MGQKLGKHNGADGGARKSLSDEEVQLLLTSTDMNREQIIEFHENFLNDCPSGVITRKEFLKMFNQLQKSEAKKLKAEKFTEYVFNALDNDSNNIIEFTDFVVCFSITSFGNLKQKISLAFRIYDLNKDNVIEKSEMLKVLEALLVMTNALDEDFGMDVHRRKASLKKKAEVHVDSIIKMLDKNGDNVIQMDEFLDGCLNDELVREILVDPMFNC